jgi:hypothetical protein
MHERYLYSGDALALVFVFWFKQNRRIPLAMWFVSFYAYISCSRLSEFLPSWPVFFVYLAAIILTLNLLRIQFKASNSLKNTDYDSI